MFDGSFPFFFFWFSCWPHLNIFVYVFARFSVFYRLLDMHLETRSQNGYNSCEIYMYVPYIGRLRAARSMIQLRENKKRRRNNQSTKNIT